ncbi:MAG TPA: hypothetical protein VGQ58_02660 [Candidatus Limnocylindrales bacterium]|jgi:hypothetical protein|nr:hypothetical protein [Candidatus Limnocylindrales bacterium]
MRFQDAAKDARAVVYAGIQADPLVARAAAALVDASPGERLLARAVMNGESNDPETWRAMFPRLFGAGTDANERARSDAILALSLEVAARGEQVRSQFRGAIVESLTGRLLARRVPPASLHRERRILFDGIRAEIHPYDVTVELPERAEAYDCKWGARGIGPDVLLQLEAARGYAEAEGSRLLVVLVVFDARRSCRVRLARQTAPLAGIRLVTLESLDALGRAKTPPATGQEVPAAPVGPPAAPSSAR